MVFGWPGGRGAADCAQSFFNLMKKSPRAVCLALSLSVFLGAAGLVTGCSAVPVTGRQRIAWMPDSELNASAAQQFEEMKKAQKVSKDAAMNACLKRVGARIVAEARKVDGSLPPFEQWELVVFDDASVNAFAMPGGKVAFYTGIFPLMTSDDEVAVVMGHEVAHVLCNHGNERVTQQLIVQGGAAVASALSEKYAKSDAMRTSIMLGYGAGSQYFGILPFSRKHEKEADRVGLDLSAKAGYDPQVAISFWEKMSAGGAQPYEFLSTHPSGTTRIAELNALMPSVLAEYRKARDAGAPAGQKLSFTAVKAK